jgi:hypothetical protein
MEERATLNETIAAIDLQLNQCDAVMTNCGSRDDAEDLARRLRVRGIQAVVSWPRGAQGPEWPKDPYVVKVSSVDREPALELLSQSRAFPAAHSDLAGLALSRSMGPENVSEPSTDARAQNEGLFDDSLLRLSIGQHRESDMIRNLRVAEPVGGDMHRVSEGRVTGSP